MPPTRQKYQVVCPTAIGIQFSKPDVISRQDPDVSHGSGSRWLDWSRVAAHQSVRVVLDDGASRGGASASDILGQSPLDASQPWAQVTTKPMLCCSMPVPPASRPPDVIPSRCGGCRRRGRSRRPELSGLDHCASTGGNADAPNLAPESSTAFTFPSILLPYLLSL